jgi:hypothetical protein
MDHGGNAKPQVVPASEMVVEGCPKTIPPRCPQLADSIGVRSADIAAHKQMFLVNPPVGDSH